MSDSIDFSPSSSKVTFLDQSMIPEYYLGEIVISQNATYFDEVNGAYAEITRGLHWCNVFDLHSMEHSMLLGYCIEVFGPNGIHVFSTPDQLRKLKGDEAELLRQPVECEKPELGEA